MVQEKPLPVSDLPGYKNRVRGRKESHAGRFSVKPLEAVRIFTTLIRETIMHIIHASALTKHYGHVVGIEDVNLQIEHGEVFGFLGPNGAGKTTTIRLLMHLLRPDRGHLELFGRPRSRQSPDLRERIGYLPGEFRPYADMTPARFLDYMARYRRNPPTLRGYLCEQLRVSSSDLNRPIKHLSHGNRQKIGIISALEHEPDLAVLDEPTLGLDPLMQASFYNIIQTLRRKEKTVFLSSHVLTEVERICDRVAIIREGRIVAEESIASLKRKRPRRLVLDFPHPIDVPPSLTGATLRKHEGRRLVYSVEKDVREILPLIEALGVEAFFLPEPDLEDVFMAYYGGEKR